MHATPISLRPSAGLDLCEKLVRQRLKRDGAATVAVSISDERQMRQLRRLWHRLSADPTLCVIDGRMESEQAGLLMVTYAGNRKAVWFSGEFKTA